MAVLLVKAYQYKQGHSAAAGDLQGVSDAGQISAWAKVQVEQALASGIMQGLGNGRFDPQGLVSRAQTTQAIYNFLRAVD
ncbi:S-layer homology domain-containing protein [Paenibacillus sp. HW567]|uniref:S-layer homology domain-containing protein n=1 Tax=Paenibacillus sp. HW567 TaxID=1034769 RepID=UPI003FA5DDBF